MCKPNEKGFLKIDPVNIYHDLSARQLMADNRTGDVFCLTNYNEIMRYIHSTQKWTKIPTPGECIKINQLVLANEKKQEIIYAATNQGIFIYLLKKKTWRKMPIHDQDILSLSLCSQRNMLTFATLEGIYNYDLQEKNKNIHLIIANAPPFSNTINAIYIDEQTDTAWLGVDGGITQFQQKTQEWHFFPLPTWQRDRVLALCTHQNDIWFGTFHNGLGKMDSRTGKITLIPGVPENSTVTSVIGDPIQKKLWFGILGTRGGVYEYNMQTQTTRVLPLLDAVSVTYLLPVNDYIWTATARGVAKFSKSPVLSQHAGDPFQPQLDFGDVLTLAFDSKGKHLWITTEYDLIRYDHVRHQCQSFSNSRDFPRPPITASLYANEKIWLGTEGSGLHMVEHDSASRVEKLADRYIISLAYDDKKKNLWVGTVYGGLSVIHLED